jgi:hypothetical protein
MTPGSVTAGHSWLVPLADLSMILFVVTGASIATLPAGQTDGDRLPPPIAAHPLSRAQRSEPAHDGFVQSVPVAVMIDGPGNPSLGNWVAAQAADRTGQLTIEGRYGSATQRERVTARAIALADEARQAGVDPRVIVAPGPRTEVAAVFAYDLDPQMARGLLQPDQ